MNACRKPLSPVRRISAPHSDSEIEKRAIALAETLLERAIACESPKERAAAEQVRKLMNDPAGRAFTFAMVDEVFRSGDAARQAARWRALIQQFGVPEFLSPASRILMGLAAKTATFLPGAVMRGVAHRMRSDSSQFILSGESQALQRYFRNRRHEGFRINLNHLGEAVLGEQEAGQRLMDILEHLADPAVDYVSVKISAIFSQIHLTAWDATLDAIKDRLRMLFRAARDGGKFVNLDMEEYQDLELTFSAFQEVLGEAEFLGCSAGIVLQAYLPDSWEAQQRLTDWARNRVALDGAPIKIRIVKGANLGMEAVHAEMHGWCSAPYPTKEDTDANFRRMLEYGCQPANAAAVRLGVASHNLFDVALGLTLREANGIQDLVEIEMLEGMANHQARATRDLAGGLLLYAPAVLDQDFLSTMAYLTRRLDENTAPENFLRDMFAMKPGSPEWKQQRHRFEQGWRNRTTVSSVSRRLVHASKPRPQGEFANEPDSDWTQAPVRTALETGLEDWAPSPLQPLVDLDTLLDTAAAAQSGWREAGEAARAAILHRAADLMSEERFLSIACMRGEAHKAIPEADAEVSEAIDFARYYARTCLRPPGLLATPLGVVAIVPPWNFPYAIACGGVLAALMAGNSVILKPAPETIQTAWWLTQQLWRAGIPREVLQFHPCTDEQGQALICDPRVSAVVLTGSLETARLFHGWRPSLPLFAETSGKNAMVISALSDRELAIKDLVRSAFGHSGQKCSAASLGILFAEVYDDPSFRRRLRDAAASLHVGPATNRRSVVTPLIREPGIALKRAFTELEPGEEWLLEPRCLDKTSNLWSPGIKLGVQPGSWFHRTECFGPVLGLMRANSLEEATDWQNATDFGLTAGLHTLDPAEIEWWLNRVEAGNLYINRGITGAIVQRQPFGGWKRSSIGPGAKAGGPNYGLQFQRLEDSGERTHEQVLTSYREAWERNFARESDPLPLKSESNILRYRPRKGVILRLRRMDATAFARANAASSLTGTPLVLSCADSEDDAAFISRLAERASSFDTLRTIELPEDSVLLAAHDAGLNWIDAPVSECGRVELRHWLREQSVSRSLHRYGQLVGATEPARQGRWS